MKTKDAIAHSPSVAPPADRHRLLWAFGLGTFLALVIVLANSGGDPDRFSYGDGEIYLYVAEHMMIPVEQMDPVVVERGPSLRYGRIGLPGTIWLLSAGDPDIMKFVQPLVIAIAAGAATAAVVALFPYADRLAAFLPFLAPGFPLAISGGYAEVLSIAAGLWGVRFALMRRWLGAAALLGLAMLTKENALFIVGGVGLWSILTRQRMALLTLSLSFLPVGIWYLIIDQRYGHIPPLDPYLRETTTTVAAPFLGLWQSLTSPGSLKSLVAVIVHLGLAIVVVGLSRRSIFGLIGAVAAFQVLTAGPFGWAFIGDAVRISSILQMFALLAIVAWKRPDWPARPALLTNGGSSGERAGPEDPREDPERARR